MRPPILDRVEEAGHVVFDNGSYDINLIGIRSRSREAGAFDDKMVIVFKDANGVWTCHWMACTTDPGIPWLEGPMKDTGCAILVPGQYRGVYTLDLHRGYRALCQRRGPVKIYRDSNKDSTLDLSPESITEGYFGINIHRSSTRPGGSRIVGRHSAGCTVIQDPLAFALLLECCQQQINHHPTWTSFTYTLLED